MNEKQLRDVSSEYLAPVDEQLADLFDKSLRLDADRFAAEVEKALQMIPVLFERMNIDALADPLEEAMGDAMLRQLKDDNWR